MIVNINSVTSVNGRTGAVTGLADTYDEEKITSRNKLDISALTPGKALNTGGTEITYAAGYLSDYIEVTDDFLVVSTSQATSGTTALRIAGYDENKDFVSGIYFTSPTSTSYTTEGGDTRYYNRLDINVSNCKYVRISLDTSSIDKSPMVDFVSSTTDYNSNYDVYETVQEEYLADYIKIKTVEALTEDVDTLLKLSRWKDKKINLKGDSIMAGYHIVGGNVEYASSYGVIAAKIVGARYANYSVSGICICPTNMSTPSAAICRSYSDMSDDADLIVIAGGVNDHYPTANPMGSMGDTTDATFYGALDVLCNGLITKYPTKTIVFVTPISQISEVANSEGKTLQDYRNAIVEVCTKYGIPTIAGNSLGFHVQNATWKTTYMTDGRHPEPAAHEIVGKSFAQAINSI